MIIVEIGFNHLGSKRLAKQYINRLVDIKGVDGITFQIRENAHRVKNPSMYLKDSDYKELFDAVKTKNKKVGVALTDGKYIPFFEQLEADFYKVIRGGIKDKIFITKLMELEKPIYVSTGMAPEEQIENLISLIDKKKKNFTLVHTQLSYNLEDSNLRGIKKMKKHGVNVAFGNHCSDEVAIFMALCYEPSDIFIYVKGEGSASYPDDKHAIEVDSITRLLDKIKKCSSAIGSGKKKEMKNKIEGSK